MNKYRKLLNKIIEKEVNISNIRDFNDNGDIEFTIKVEDLGIDIFDLNVYSDEFYSNFVADIVGELIVRDNINQFIKKFNDYGCNFEEDRFEHKHFGLKVRDKKITFSFHYSLLKKIITNDFIKMLDF